MESTTSLKSNFTSPEYFESFLAKRSWEPGWLADFRKDSWEKLKVLPAAKSKDERWRFSPRSRLGYSNCREITDVPLIPKLSSIENGSTYFDTFDETILSSPEMLVDLPKFINPNLGSDETFFLGCCFSQSGFVLHARKDGTEKKLLTCNHFAPATRKSQFQISSIHLEPFTEITLIEFFESENAGGNGILSNLSNIHLSQGSKLNRILVQKLNDSSTFNHLENIFLEKDSEFTNISLQLGGAQSRIESNGIIAGEGASFNNFSLSLGRGEQLFDQRTIQHHKSPNGKSNLLFKNALLDESKSIFSGLIKVDQDAKNTDAYQTNRNLLLSDNAEADSLPGLEILANEVKCSHGATTSKIDEQELFYLLSRGIPRKTAEKLVVLGFFDEIIREVNSDQTLEMLREEISKYFN